MANGFLGWRGALTLRRAAIRFRSVPYGYNYRASDWSAEAGRFHMERHASQVRSICRSGGAMSVGASNAARLPEPGFAAWPSVLSKFETEQVLDALQTTARTRAGARHLMRVPSIAALATDPRLLRVAAAVLGASAVPYRATLFDKSLESNWLVAWHQDTALPVKARVDHPGWGPWSTKAGVLYAIAPAWALEQVVALRVHLDDSGADNGALRVIPGSHRQGVLSREDVEALVRKRAAVECIARAGDILSMRPLLVHASSKARTMSPRRVIHIEYATTLLLDGAVELEVA